jgi:hypothetical protein
VIAAKKCFAFAPTAAANEFTFVFDDKVSSVADQLPIHAEDQAKGAVHLRGGVVRLAVRELKAESFF